MTLALTHEKASPEHHGQPLEITRRMLGSSALVSHNPGERDISVALDVESFVRRLLLFDTYVLYSVRLKEIPEMVRYFGLQGTMQLLSSGALEIRHECAQFTEGQFKTPPCPPMTFQFHVIEAHVWEQYLMGSLGALGTLPTLSARELMDLQSAVVKAVRRGDNRQMFASEVSPAFESELLHNERLIEAAVRLVLSKHHSVCDVAFDVKTHKVGDARYEVETNLRSKLNLGTQEIHDAIKAALLGVSGLVQRIGEMKVHVALSGFTEEELPLFRTKLGSLADALGAEKYEDHFLRVISISGLRDIAADQRIDVEKLLRIREEPEAIEFRGWLAGVDKLSVVEIKHLVASFNAKLGLAVQTTAGKGLRLMATTVVGIAFPIAGSISVFLISSSGTSSSAGPEWRCSLTNSIHQSSSPEVEVLLEAFSGMGCSDSVAFFPWTIPLRSA